DDDVHPSTDVAALGRLLRRLATGPDARPLRRLAEAAMADDPDARPTAAALATELAAVPGARLPVLPDPACNRAFDPHDLRALVARMVAAPWSSPPADSRPTAAPSRSIPAPTALSPTTTATPVTRPLLPTRSDCVPPASVLIADVDADGCPDGLRYADGILEGAGLRWAVGQAGDQVAVGDWGCRGARTLVVPRPATGEVFRFDGWAVGGLESL